MNNPMTKIMGNIKYCILKPAYGRQYKTEHQMLTAWNEGKDFQMFNAQGPYTSVRDFLLLKDQFDHIILECSVSKIQTQIL